MKMGYERELLDGKYGGRRFNLGLNLKLKLMLGLKE